MHYHIQSQGVVNGSAYMNFRNATDSLFDTVSHADLAKALGVSVPSIRQARLAEGSKARRSPPDGWERAVISLAERRIRRYQMLIGRLGKHHKEDRIELGREQLRD
jgi:hypothetical protein